MSVCLLKAPKRSLMQHKTLVNIVSSAKPSNVLSGENHTCSREIIKCCPAVLCAVFLFYGRGLGPSNNKK